MGANFTEDEVKKQLRSLLTSNARISTLKELETDYRSMIGCPVPFMKLGYNSMEHFLKSIPDVCTVRGSGPLAQVLVVVTEKTAHINEMVTRQRVAKCPSRRSNFAAPPRRRNTTSYRVSNDMYNRPAPLYQPGNSLGYSGSQSYVNQNFTNLPVTSNPTTPQAQSSKQFSRPTHQESNNHNRSIAAYLQSQHSKAFGRPAYQDLNNYNSSNNVQAQPPEECSRPIYQESNNYDKSNANIQSQSPKEISSPTNQESNNYNRSNNVQKQPTREFGRPIYQPENTPQQNSFTRVEENNLSKELMKLTVNSEEGDEDTSNVPKKVQENLKVLIGRFEDGLWCGDLRECYRKTFRRELLYIEYGYSSLIEMCIALKHIFHYVRPGNDDFKLYDRSKPLPVTVEKVYTIASYDDGTNTRRSNSALPQLDWSDFKQRIPKDVFAFGSEIPRQFLPKTTQADSVFDVIVMEIYDVSKFWIYLGDQEPALNELMDKIQTFYKDPVNAKEYSIVPGALREGLYCVQVVLNEFNRAKVIRVFPDDRVRIYCIDYGTVEDVPFKGMCFLSERFAELPAQAIRCRLANLIPTHQNHVWPPSCTRRFFELTNDRKTKMKVSYVHWQDEYVSGFIADVTNLENVHYVNEVLVQEGHALWQSQPQQESLVIPRYTCIAKQIHLFPTFMELESGLAPNFECMERFANVLLPVQFCLNNYFELNSQVGDKPDMDSIYECYINCVRCHRKYRQHAVPLVKEASVDFDVFGNYKNNIMAFLAESGVQPSRPVCNSEPENKVFCERVLKKLEQYCQLESDFPLSSLEEDDFNSDLMEDLVDVSVVTELSETATPQNPVFSGFGNRTANSDINIFDNPEAFEDLPSSSPDSRSPLTVDEFNKALEKFGFDWTKPSGPVAESAGPKFEEPSPESSSCVISSSGEPGNRTPECTVNGLEVNSILNPNCEEFVSSKVSQARSPTASYIEEAVTSSGLMTPTLIQSSSCDTLRENVSIVCSPSPSDSDSSSYAEPAPRSCSTIDNISSASHTIRAESIVPTPRSVVPTPTSVIPTPKALDNYVPPVQFPAMQQYVPPISGCYPQWSSATGYPFTPYPYGVQQFMQSPRPSVRPPPGYEALHYRGTPLSYNAPFPPYGAPYPNYGYSQVPYSNVTSRDFYDRFK